MLSKCEFALYKYYLAFSLCGCQRKSFGSIVELMSPYFFSDLGAHIDGFIAVVAHTVVVGASVDHKVKGRAADAIVAAHFASEAALRLLKPGNEVNIICFCLNFFFFVDD